MHVNPEYVKTSKELDNSTPNKNNWKFLKRLWHWLTRDVLRIHIY